MKTTKTTKQDLSKQTVASLKTIAKELHIVGISRMRKDEIIDAIISKEEEKVLTRKQEAAFQQRMQDMEEAKDMIASGLAYVVAVAITTITILSRQQETEYEHIVVKAQTRHDMDMWMAAYQYMTESDAAVLSTDEAIDIISDEYEYESTNGCEYEHIEIVEASHIEQQAIDFDSAVATEATEVTEEVTEKATTKTIHLQGIGEHEAIEASELKPGMVIIWNYGNCSIVDSVKPSKTGKTITLSLISCQDRQMRTRRMNANTLVAIDDDVIVTIIGRAEDGRDGVTITDDNGWRSTYEYYCSIAAEAHFTKVFVERSTNRGPTWEIIAEYIPTTEAAETYMVAADAVKDESMSVPAPQPTDDEILAEIEESAYAEASKKFWSGDLLSLEKQLNHDLYVLSDDACHSALSNAISKASVDAEWKYQLSEPIVMTDKLYTIACRIARRILAEAKSDKIDANDKPANDDDTKEYVVSFMRDEDGVSCANIAVAQCVEDVEAHYADCYWMVATKASEYPVSVDDLKRRGYPVVVCEHIDDNDDEPVNDDASDDSDEQPTMGAKTSSATDLLDMLGMGYDEYDEASDDAKEAIDAIWHELVVWDDHDVCYRWNSDIDNDETGAIVERYAESIWDEQGNVITCEPTYRVTVTENESDEMVEEAEYATSDSAWRCYREYERCIAKGDYAMPVHATLSVSHDAGETWSTIETTKSDDDADAQATTTSSDRMILAKDIVDYSQDVDPYAITTNIDDASEAVRALAADLNQCVAWLEEQVDEYDDDRARDLIDRIMAANHNDDENRGDTTMTTATIYRIEGHEGAILGTIRAMLETSFKTAIDRHISDEIFARDIESATIQRGTVTRLKTDRFAYLAYDDETNTLRCYDEFTTPADVLVRIDDARMTTWSRESFQNHSGGYSHITTGYIREYIIDHARYDGTALWNWGIRITKTHGTLIDIAQQAKNLGCEIDGDIWRAMLESLSFDNLATKTSDQICDELAHTIANAA